MPQKGRVETFLVFFEITVSRFNTSIRVLDTVTAQSPFILCSFGFDRLLLQNPGFAYVTTNTCGHCI